MATDRFEQVFRHSFRLSGVGVRQEHRELVAAETGDDVGVAEAVPQKQRQAGQEIVTGTMAAAIVHVFELVEVEKEQRAMRAVALRLRELAIEFFIETPPVEQSGEWIMVRDVHQLRFEALTLADITETPDASIDLVVAHQWTRVALEDAPIVE